MAANSLLLLEKIKLNNNENEKQKTYHREDMKILHILVFIHTECVAFQILNIPKINKQTKVIQNFKGNWIAKLGFSKF